MIRNGRIYLQVPWRYKDHAKAIIGSRWHPVTREWSWPAAQWPAVGRLRPDLRDDLQSAYNRWMDEQEITNRYMLGGDPLETTHNIFKEMEKLPTPEYVFKLKPYDHQVTMWKAGITHNLFAFFCEMGTGKSKVIVDIIAYLKSIGQRSRSIIFAPKTVIFNWGEEIDMSSNLSYTIATGSRRQKETALKESVDIVITNYESVLSVDLSVWEGFDIAILDESSRIKNHKAKRTKELLSIFTGTPRKYILTGTPITQSPADIWAQFAFLDLGILGNKTWYSFRNNYLVMGGYQNYQVVGYKNLETLKKKIEKVSIQLKKEECIDLPDKVYETRQIEMSKVLAAQYKKMRTELVLELDGGIEVTAQVVLTKLLRLQEITAGKYLPDQDQNEKLKELYEIIKEVLENDRQIVIWARFRDSLSVIADYLTRHSLVYSLIHGDVVDRQTEIKKFQERKVPIFLGQERTGGLGINLTSGSTVVYYENTFSLEDRKQSEDRIHRIGQKLKCTYIDLVYKGTVDEHVLAAIQKKQDIAHYLVDSFEEGRYSKSRRTKC